MSFHEQALTAIDKKQALFRKEPIRFATRAILAGVYLGIITAFAAATATLVDQSAPGWGKYAFGIIFASALYVIIVLQGELATGDMMFMTYGTVQRKVSIGHGMWTIVFVTLFNLLGAFLTAWLISQSTIGHDAASNPDAFLPTLLEAKLAKSNWTLLCEGILANMVVNIAFLMSTFAGKDYGAKLWGIIFVIPAFACMGYEHSIANFVLTGLGTFIWGGDAIDGMTVLNVLRNWSVVWVGNIIGGGLIIGGLYGWLNRTKTQYTD